MGETHGMSNSHIYGLYHHIKDRCFNPNHHEFHNYGGRGIGMCDEWLGKDGFKNFYQWAINNGYEYGLTIDRINNDGDYSMDNCRWITRSENVSKANSARRTQHRMANKGTYWGRSPEGYLYIFNNANLFADQHNLNGGCVRTVANHRAKTHHGWTFGFLSDFLNERQE